MEAIGLLVTLEARRGKEGASPMYQHKPNPLTGIVDPLADVGIWICAHVPGLHQHRSPPDWVYNHISLGPGMLALALRLHWLYCHRRPPSRALRMVFQTYGPRSPFLNIPHDLAPNPLCDNNGTLRLAIRMSIYGYS
jgi:hypothetical protein